MTDGTERIMRSAYWEYWRHTGDLVFVKGLNGVWLDASASMARSTGWERPEELIGRTDFQIFKDQELARRYTDDDARLLASGAAMENYVEPFVSQSSAPRYCLTSKYILRDDAGRPSGILGVSRDITMEYEARQNYENELRDLFELPPDTPVAVLFDVTSWRVVDVRYRDGEDHVVSRYSRIDDFFKNAADSVVCDEGVRAKLRDVTQEQLQKIYSSGKRSFTLEYLRRMPDGRERWVRDEMHFLLDPVNGNLSLIVLLRDIDEQKQAYSKLVRAAERDAMTGLLNHDAILRGCEEYLSGASGQQALFVIDLDNFKQVNDNFGHQCGDRILTDTAAAIRRVFRSTDLVGRLGGDEFMVLMKDVHSTGFARNKAEELVSALQFSAASGERSMELSTSVGIVIFQAGEHSFNSLYAQADSALYRSKGSGRNRYSIFCPDCQGDRRMSAPVLENVTTVQLRTLLDYMDGGVIMAEVKDDIIITYVSPSLYRSFSRDNDGERRRNVFSFVLPEDLPGLRGAVIEAAASNDLVEHAYRVNGNDGPQWRHIRVKRIPERGDGVHRVVAVVTDISNLTLKNERLREAEERYRIAVEQTDATLWEVDLAARTIDVYNTEDSLPAPTEVLKNAPEGLIHSGLLPASAAPELRRMFADMYAGNDKGVYFLPAYDKNGEDSWVRLRFRLLRSESDVPYRALCIAQNVPNINAEMSRFEQELRFSDIVRDSLRGCLRANLTQNRLELITIDEDPRYQGMQGMAYDGFLRLRDVFFVDGDDMPQLRELLSRENLLELFRSGESWQYLDYRHVTAAGERRWTSLLVRLMRHPVSGEVYAFGYLRDNEVRRRWELSLGVCPQREATSLLYSRETMSALAEHLLASCGKDRLATVSIIELAGLDRIRSSMGAARAGDLLSTFGRLCWIIIGGDVIIGQLDENHTVMLRLDAVNPEDHRQRVQRTVASLKRLLPQAHSEADVTLTAGFSVARAGEVGYETLLRRASLACRSVALTAGEAVAAYEDMGPEPPAEEGGAQLAARFRALELRYQQQANRLRLSENDTLTGLPGKRAFLLHARELLEQDPEGDYALIRFDINRFKVYNDVRGTAAGDRLLRDIASMLRSQSAVRLSGRLESDHFVLLMPCDAGAIARSEARLAQWLAERSPDFHLSSSVGIYRVEERELDVTLMCDRALMALRSVKSGFDNRMALYDAALRDRMLEEQRLVNDMDGALRDGQFEIYFQPQINYEDGSLIGAEALVRWNHPERGMLLPAAFIPLFEQNGLITRLDEYVWDRCCRELRRWTGSDPRLRELTVSVNVSRLDIYDPRLCDTLTELLRRYELPPSALKLEITESAYMEDPRQLIDVVHRLQSAGFTIEMDDFGNGYSSLNTLKDVPVDILKLDMKFLSEGGNSVRGGNILGSIIRMAHWLRIPIIAEGVESRAQAEYLKSLGCVYMQGYYFDRPMPAADFETLALRSRLSLTDRYRDANVEGMAAFWDPSSETTLLFNSLVDGTAILEYSGEGESESLHIVRANDRFYRELGTTRTEYLSKQTTTLSRFDEENGRALVAMLREAERSGGEAECEIESLPQQEGAPGFWTRNRARMLARNGNVRLFYMSTENVTRRRQPENEKAAPAAGSPAPRAAASGTEGTPLSAE